MQFDDFYLHPDLLKAVAKAGFQQPTAVQVDVIPALLSGKDVFAQAPTGSGKTAAYLLPIIQNLLDSQARQCTTLILVPTRELALQIYQVGHHLARNLPINWATLTGGVSPAAQLEHAADCQVLIATPGRLLNQLVEQQIELPDLTTVIIDEADRMLDMGQGPDVMAVLDLLEVPAQAALFSATLTGAGVRHFAEQILDQPQIIQINAANEQAAGIEQQVYLADNREHKQQLLESLISDENCQQALVFCNKKTRSEAVCQWLQSRNISAQVMHGDFEQKFRRDRMRKFRQGKIKVLVVTDVASRGLDVPAVSHVINYDVPFRGDIYIHRIGRTARGDQHGYAVNLVEPHDQRNLQRIEHYLQTRLPLRKRPGLPPRAPANRKYSKQRKKDGNKN